MVSSLCLTAPRPLDLQGHLGETLALTFHRNQPRIHGYAENPCGG